MKNMYQTIVCRSGFGMNDPAALSVVCNIVGSVVARVEKFDASPSLSLAKLRDLIRERLGCSEAGVALLLNGKMLSVGATLADAYEGQSISLSPIHATLTPVAKSSAPADLISGYELVDADKHDEELECRICFCPCVDPVIMPCCQNMICRTKCLKGSGGECPFDRQTWTAAKLSEPQRLIKNMLERVEVKCNACGMTMKRGLRGEIFDQHAQTGCPIACPDGCGAVLTRDKLASHASVHAKEKQCAALNPSSTDFIKLSVGGTQLVASRNTLTKYPDSLLGAMFLERTRKLNRDGSGTVLIEAPLQPFLHVLAWLQRGVVPRELSCYDADLLLQEARTWQLDELVAGIAPIENVNSKAPKAVTQDRLLLYMGKAHKLCVQQSVNVSQPLPTAAMADSCLCQVVI